MPRSSAANLSRREFVAASAAGAALLAGLPTRADARLPRRVLGRTGAEVTILGLGCACAGQSNSVDEAGAERVFQTAIDAGINYIDAARVYGKAEAVLGRILPARRDELFVVTKAAADSYEEARRSFETSLRLLRVDHVDCLYWHGIGYRDIARALDDGSAFRYLLDQKAAGKTRFVGFTSHAQPTDSAALLETGLIDSLMVVLNLADRHLYDYETKLLPAARRHHAGILAMKVFGGMRGNDFSRYNGPPTGPHLEEPHLPLALRYALSLEGVAAAVLGVHSPEQVLANVAQAKAFEPLSAAEWAQVDGLGRDIAAGWEPRFGGTA